MKRPAILLLLVLSAAVAFGQDVEEKRISGIGDFTAGAGSYRGSFSLAYYKNVHPGKARKIGVGLGLRWTTFVGANLYYITAPASLTSGSTGPLVIFKENIAENIDSLLIKSPQVNSFNLVINLQYKITNKITAGFNIDAIGFSLGSTKQSNYINGLEGRITTAKPTDFNILLISDNDKGSLNSEFYARYQWKEKLSFKIAAQFLFTEYTTDIKVQRVPEENDRFRNKALLGAIGIAYHF